MITSLVSYTYAGDPMQSFWNTIDKMPIEKRIDFYEKAIHMLQQVKNNPAAKNIAQTMISKYDVLKNQSIWEQIQDIENIPNIDYASIRKEWLEKHNTTRSQAGLEMLQNNHKLNKTAQIRANYLAANSIPSGSTHKRESTDRYYDYNKILTWFETQGVTFTKTDDTAFSENVWYWYYRSCSKEDCTNALSKAIESTRDFFIGEASRNWPHYRALMGSRFTEIWIGISRNADTKRYYVVVHYGVKLQ